MPFIPSKEATSLGFIYGGEVGGVIKQVQVQGIVWQLWAEWACVWGVRADMAVVAVQMFTEPGSETQSDRQRFKLTPIQTPPLTSHFVPLQPLLPRNTPSAPTTPTNSPFPLYSQLTLI